MGPFQRGQTLAEIVEGAEREQCEADRETAKRVLEWCYIRGLRGIASISIEDESGNIVGEVNPC